MTRGAILCMLSAGLCGRVAAGLLDEIAATDRRADEAVAAVGTPDALVAKQAAWRKAWIAGLGGLPERTPLNAQEGTVVHCDGFTLQNVLFESLPGVYVVGHLAIPDSSAFRPPYPAVLMPMGHSNEGILAPRYAAHLAMMARAGFAAFSWDPISQGERRQSSPAFDYADNCSTEHTRLGARGWLVGWNFARFRLWDGMRALDYLETRRDVDCSKVGVCGTSGGGTMSAYLQALDPRIAVAFPNCYVSSIRAVFAKRGCHDAEQFFWNQLNDGVNHAAILAMGFPRVSLATGSRWADYFPHAGAVSTFAVYSNLTVRLSAFQTIKQSNRALAKPVDATACRVSKSGGHHLSETRQAVASTDPGGFASASNNPTIQQSNNQTICPFHFSCAGPHGLPLPTRAAQTDWMTHCVKGGPAPKPLADYWALSTGDHSGTNDPCARAALPFPTEAAFFTKTHQVRDLKGFRSLYDLLADRARDLAKARQPKTREQLREIVRRRANIRPLSELCGACGRGVPTASEGGELSVHSDAERTPRLRKIGLDPFDPPFGWWYLKGAYGMRRENEAAMLATLGRSVVGRDAERIIVKAVTEILKANPGMKVEQLFDSAVQPSTFNLQPRIPLKAESWDCIAAAHAYAAEPQLFSSIEFDNMPPSWTAMVTNPDPKDDSYAIGVWGALEEYDWTDLVKQNGETACR